MARPKKTKAEIDAAAERAIAEIVEAVQSKTGQALVKIARKQLRWLEVTATGRPKPTMMNAYTAIEALGLEAKFDMFHGRYTINGTSLQGFVGELSDKVTRKVRQLSLMHFGLDPGREAMFDGVRRACEEHRFDPMLDYLDGLRWDGVKRIDTWLTTYLGVEDTPLHRAWGRIALLAAVRRLREHGCKFDHVLVLEGPEGIFKSTVVQVLASGRRGGTENFSDSPILNTDERKQQELTQGVWFYEVAELAGMRKADQYAIKNFITKQEERARPAYAQFQEIQPRVCIFIGTFNTTAGGELIEYLNVGDNRRWWPVRVALSRTIDIESLIRDRDQLFAEADFEATFGDNSLYLSPELETEAKVIQQAREVTDPLIERLSNLFDEVLAERTIAAQAERIETDDGRSLVHRLLMANGVHVKHGRDYIITDAEVWVSSKLVVEQLPTQLSNDGKRITAAMRACGWQWVNDRRSGEKRRGYVRQRRATPSSG